MAVRAGKLRDRITFERDVATDGNAIGELAEDWQPFASCVPAAVKFKSGVEQDNSNATGATAGYTIEIRYRDDIKTSDRINWDGKILNIESAGDPYGDRKKTVITARENVTSRDNG